MSTVAQKLAGVGVDAVKALDLGEPVTQGDVVDQLMDASERVVRPEGDQRNFAPSLNCDQLLVRAKHAGSDVPVAHTHSLLIGEICPVCTKFRSLASIMAFAGGKLCEDCYHAHLAALDVLSTARPPQECSECHATREQLFERLIGDTQVVMTVHMENGIYRCLCMNCDTVYTKKRRELYGDTEFGHALKLK